MNIRKKYIARSIFKIILADFLFFQVSFFVNAQNNNPFATADSLYNDSSWKNAQLIYARLIADTSTKGVRWSRLGYCYYNTGAPEKALACYKKAMACKDVENSKNILYARISRVYASEQEFQKTYLFLDSAISTGYSNCDELDTLKEYKKIRPTEKFKQLRAKAYTTAYPCSTDPKSRLYDFWLGDWIVYQSGTNIIVGYSKNEKASGECMILENWTSTRQQYCGIAMNFYDPEKGKWEKLWVGSEGGPGVVHHYINGEFKENYMRFEYTLPGDNGIEQPGRYSIYKIDDRKNRLIKELSQDQGKTFDVILDFMYIKK